MTSGQFKQWRERMQMSQQAAADALGISKATVINYESGTRREDNRPVVIPKIVELACAALTFGIAPTFSAPPEDGPFKMIEIEIKKQGPFGEVVEHLRKVVPHPFKNRAEAEEMAQRVAASHGGGYGYNPERGYWWGRDLRGVMFQFIVEPVS
ncbi:MAG TPA: helix-turn-helix transcriptional regulator [Xanthobacteraceae bacterium]|jgi:transcriptional regulator with XRE-family HTH domain|nr:helix-turn-helix transcriptional regulator [Xanthobacteraceae bacterium]